MKKYLLFGQTDNDGRPVERTRLAPCLTPFAHRGKWEKGKNGEANHLQGEERDDNEGDGWEMLNRNDEKAKVLRNFENAEIGAMIWKECF